MSVPVRPIDLWIAKFAVVAKLTVLTHGFVFLLFTLCGKMFAGLSGWPPMALALYLLRGALGTMPIIAVQLLLAMVIRSFAVPIFLGLIGGIAGILISAKGASLFWPYSLMQIGMNANKQEDLLAGKIGLFFLSCSLWFLVLLAASQLVLQKKDVRA